MYGYRNIIILLKCVDFAEEIGYNMYRKSLEINSKEDDVMDVMAIRKLDKSNMSGLTSDKKKLLKSLQGAASSPIDFNKIRDEQKYGEDRL
jgi:hypothetical protein